MNRAEEIKIQVDIAKRAVQLLAHFNVQVSRLETLMDIDYVNRICPLRLQELLDATDEDFLHDITGIYRHFNRQTKQLEGHFTPRFADASQNGGAR